MLKFGLLVCRYRKKWLCIVRLKFGVVNIGWVRFGRWLLMMMVVKVVSVLLRMVILKVIGMNIG